MILLKMTFTPSLVSVTVLFFTNFDTLYITDFDNKNASVDSAQKQDHFDQVNNTKATHADLSNNTVVQELSIPSVHTTKGKVLKVIEVENRTANQTVESIENKDIKTLKTKKNSEIVTKKPDEEDCLLLKWLFVCRDFQMLKDKDIFAHAQ